jgi:DNA-binding NarL/FixJ family response regulator
MPSDPLQSGLPRVIVVDADDRVRGSLIGLLGISHRVAIIGSAGAAAPALDLAAIEQPDIIVIDPRLPDVTGGLALIRRLRATVPGVRIVALCSAEAMDGGQVAANVDGCVRKTFRPDDLMAAILDTHQSVAT